MADYNINAITRRVVYTGSAGLGPYAFSFEIIDQADVGVYFNQTALTLSSDYTVTINANGTGSVNIITGGNVPSTPTANDTIIIIGARDIERTTDFVTAGDLLASSLNEQLDSNIIFEQQIDERVDRSIKFPVYDSFTGDNVLPAAATRADKILKFDTDGNVGVETASALFAGTVVGANFTNNTFTGDGSQTAFTTTVEAGSKNNAQVYIDGVYQLKSSFSVSGFTLTFTEAPPLNSQIEVIIGNAISTIAGDAGNVDYNQGGTGAQTRTVENKLQDVVSVKDFGAIGDGVTDDTAAIQNALNYIRDSSTGGKLIFPTGAYKCTSGLTLIQTVNDSNRHWVIDGCGSKLDFSSMPASTSGALIQVGATSGNYVYRERALTVISNLFVLGPETQNAYVSGGPASPTPDGGTIGLQLDNCLNVNLHSLHFRRCYTGISTNKCWPVNAYDVIANACYIGIKIESTSTLGKWINCGADTARHAVVIAATEVDGGIGSQYFYGLRVENCLRGVSIDQGISTSGTANQVRDITFSNTRFEQIAYDLFRIGKVWDFAVTSADSADRNAAYCNNVTIHHGRGASPITSGYIIRASNNSYARCFDIDFGFGDFSSISGQFDLSRIFCRLRTDGGASSGQLKLTNGTALICNAGIDFPTASGNVDFTGATHLGSGTRVSTELDRYEEGTWTPILADASQSDAEGQTYTSRYGEYTLIGNRVLFNIRIVMSGLGTLTSGDAVQISLPISVGTNGSGAAVVGDAYNLNITSGQSVVAKIVAGADWLTLQLSDTALGVTSLLVSELTSTSEFAISGQYKI